MKSIFFFTFYIICSSALFAQKADDIEGVWWNEIKSIKIKVERKEDKYIGTIVYIIPEKYINGSPAKDAKNPNPELRKRSLLNFQILCGLKFDPNENEWKDGEIYDPKTGNTYDCYVWLEDNNTLQIKGFVAGIRLLGRVSTCTRTTF